jgi:hypothetical protein
MAALTAQVNVTVTAKVRMQSALPALAKIVALSSGRGPRGMTSQDRLEAIRRIAEAVLGDVYAEVAMDQDCP